MSSHKLKADSSFNRYEFLKNLAYQSFNKPCQYLIIERVYMNSKSAFTKLKKQDNMAFSEVMQYNSG